MGVWNSVDSSQLAFSTSRSRTRKIIAAIKGEEDFSVDDHTELLLSPQSEKHKENELSNEAKLGIAFASMDAAKKRAIMKAIEGKTSN